MTHFESVRVGLAGYPTDSRANPGTASANFGVPTSPIYCYTYVPAALLTNNLAAAQTVSGSPATFTLTASTGVTTTSINGVTYLDLGQERSIRATGASTAVTAVSITLSGLDDYQVPLTNTFTGPVSTATTESTKTFRYLQSATATGNSTSSISLGTGDTYGFPLRADTFGQVELTWDNAKITSSAGFTAASSVTATATTGPVRGSYTVQSASNGTRRLYVWITPYGMNSVTEAYGVAQA